MAVRELVARSLFATVSALALVLSPCAVFAADEPDPEQPSAKHAEIGGIKVNTKLLDSSPDFGRDSIKSEDLKEWVKVLAGDEMKGRLAYTPECDKAAEYVAGRFKEWGLKPVGQDGTYFQPIRTLKKTTGPGAKAALVLFKGAEDKKGESFEPGKAFFPHPMGKEGEAEAEVVFAGYGISAPQAKYDDYEGVDAKGKIVLLMRFAPQKDKAGTPFTGQNFPRFAALNYKLSNAKSHGAVGALMVQGPMHWDGPEKIEFPADWPQQVKGQISFGQIAIATADAILAAGNAGKLAEAQKAIETSGKPASCEMKGVRVKLVSDLTATDVTSRNVVGLLEGSDPKAKDEAVVLGAHYDHVGTGGMASRTGKSGAVHYGADDNASGTVGVMALARAFAKNPARPRRSILFIALTGEELGLLGSQFYVDHPLIPLKQTVAMLNFDMIGRSKTGEVNVMGVGTSPVFRGLLADAAKAYPKLKPGYSFSGTAPSDNTSFYRKGIPVLFFHTGLHNEYHTPADTWDKLNLDIEVEVCKYAYDVTAALAEREEKLPFVEPSKGPYLGINLGSGGEGKGAIVASVQAGSPADKGGLEPGDLIVKFGGTQVRSGNDLQSLLMDHKPDDAVEAVVLRDGAEATLKLTLGSRGR